MPSLPSLQFYPGDWRKDPAVQSCSLAARGLWFEMLMVMFQSPRRGYLTLGGEPMTIAQISRSCGASEADVTLALQELENAGVYSKDRRQIIYSRRMVRDEEKRVGTKARVAKSRNIKSNCNANVTPNVTADVTPLKHRSSSSSSSSVTYNPIIPFQDFWDIYPRRTARSNAEKSWAKLKPSQELFDRICNALAWQRETEDWRKENGKFIPHPATWLNQKRWEDEEPFVPEEQFEMTDEMIRENMRQRERAAAALLNGNGQEEIPF